MSLRLTALFAFLVISFAAFAQAPDSQATPSAAAGPVITFDLNFPGALPAHYAMSVDSTGRASYRSDGASDDAPVSDNRASASAVAASQPFTSQFTLSADTRKQIFELARQANYFNGNFEFKGGRIANTGAKTLTYAEGPQSASLNDPTNGKHFRTTYNYSQNPAIQQLTSIFQRIATTMEFGNRLTYQHRFDRMSLEAELKRMEELQKSHELLEVQGVGTVLRDIANDSAVFNVTRQRALRLLKAGGGEVAAAN